MADQVTSHRPDQRTSPSVPSYDDGYEFSLDRYVDTRLLVLDADKQMNDLPATLASAF